LPEDEKKMASQMRLAIFFGNFWKLFGKFRSFVDIFDKKVYNIYRPLITNTKENCKIKKTDSSYSDESVFLFV